MEKEDPIERIERERQEKKNNGPLRAAMYIMIAVAVALAVALACVLISKNAIVKELDGEKAELTERVQALQADYESLSSDYASINAQLDSSREEIAQLIDKVKKTQATNRSKLRQYERELGTLRSIMRGYIVQIDSLNHLNHKLTVEAASARKEAAEQKKQNKELTAKVEDLSGRVAEGSILKARAIRIEAQSSADKATDKASRVVRLLVNMTLIENSLAEKGPVRVYVCVTDPEGNLLRDGTGASFDTPEGSKDATASRIIDYNGKEIDLGIYVNNIPSFEKGVYTVKAYTLQSELGSAELFLR